LYLMVQYAIDVFKVPDSSTCWLIIRRKPKDIPLPLLSPSPRA